MTVIYCFQCTYDVLRFVAEQDASVSLSDMTRNFLHAPALVKILSDLSDARRPPRMQGVPAKQPLPVASRTLGSAPGL